MRKVFWENPYQKELTTHVAQINGNEIVCDATIAYSFAGGQESDTMILAAYNDIIKSNKIIHTDYSDIQNHRRFWKIDGFAQVPCGGTHVKSTAEVGYVTLKRDRPGKSIERIEIRLVDDSVPLALINY